MSSKKKQIERRIERDLAADGAAPATPRPTSGQGVLPPEPDRSRWLSPILVLFLAVFVNLNTLDCGFTWDDQWLILDNARLTDPAERWGYIRYMLFERDKLWRPLKRISLLIDYSIWGREHPGGFHATNIAFGAGCALALYFLIQRLSGRRWLAMATALLFAVHPIHAESIANISHRKEPMSLLFSLLAFLAYLAARSGSPPIVSLSGVLGKLAVLRGRPLAIATAIEFSIYGGFLYFCGILSKEVGAVALPASIVAYELALAPGKLREKLKPALLCLIPFVLALGLYGSRGYLNLPKRFQAEQIDWVTGGKTKEYSDVLLLGAKSTAESFRLLVWPWPLYLDRKFEIPNHLAADSAQGFLVIGVALAGLWVSFRRAPLAFLALTWGIANYLPVSGFVPLTHWLVAERFLYVPSVAFVLLMALALEQLRAGRVPGVPHQVATAALVALVVGYGALTLRQNRIWLNSSTLWSHTLKYNPTSYRGLYGYGLELDNSGEDETGEEYYRRAIAVEPSYPEPHYALGLLLLNQRKYDEAIAEAEIHAGIARKDPEPYIIIGNARFGQRRYNEAADAYEKAVARAPKHADAYYNFANAAYAAGDYPRAAAAIDQALVFKKDGDVYYLRGSIYQQLHRNEEALESFHRAASLQPKATESLNAIVTLLLQERRFEESRPVIEQSLAIDAEQPRMLNLLEQIKKLDAK